MNIGLDLDGPLMNQERFQLRKGTEFFKKQYIKEYYKNNGVKLKKTDVQVLDLITGKQINGKEIDLTKPYIKINSNGYGIAEIFDCDKEQEAAFWYKYMPFYALFVPFRKDAVRVIKQLHSEGNKFYVVTARAKSNENNLIGKIQRGLVILRLKLAKVPYEKITFCSYEGEHELQDKVSACIDNKLDLMIEDKKGNAEVIEQKTSTKTFLYATKNNADIKSKDLPRFVNFGELYNGIKKQQETEKFTLLHKEEKTMLTDEELENYYKSYRDYHTKYVYDRGIIKVREENLRKLVKYGKYVFDRFSKYEVINIDRMPKEDGVIITTNHRDMLDIPHVIRAMGERPSHPILKSEFLDTKAEGILTDIGCTFVNRDDKSIREQARETASKLVLSGSNVIVCPEGTRNKTNNLLLNFDFGAVSIAQNTGKLIYPCAVYRGLNHRIVNFGNPISVGINDNLNESNNILYNRTIELLEECRKREEEKLLQESQETASKTKILIKK